MGKLDIGKPGSMRRSLEGKIDLAIGHAASVGFSKATILGHGARVPVTHPAQQPAKLGFEYKLDRAVGQSADIKAYPTVISRPNQLTHNQAQMAASDHVRRIENLKGQREASAARTAEVRQEIARVQGQQSGFNEDQPRDEQGRWV